MTDKRYTDIFIDFDDTVYDTRNNAIIALKELYDEQNLSERLRDEQLFYDIYWQTNLHLWGLYNQGEIERDYLIVERFRRPLVEAAKDDGAWATREYCLKVSDRFLDLCSNKSGLIEGAQELMDFFRQNGYRVHICSNGFHEIQYKKLRACGLPDYFDSVILSEDAGANKPSPIFFDYALKTTGASKETTLMIGDNYKADVLGAMNSGIDAILYNRWSETSWETVPLYIANKLIEIKDFLTSGKS